MAGEIPVANAGTQQEVSVGDIVYLNGINSSDPEDDVITSYTWELVAIPTGSSAELDDTAIVNPSFEADLAGIYIASLVVVAGGGTSLVSNVTISVAESGLSASEKWDRIVGDKTLEDGGYVGDLMIIARLHIEEAKGNGELTSAEAGEVYSAMIPAAFSNGMKFGMEGELVDAKIELEQDKLLTAAANRDVLTAQKALYERQTAGFDDNKHQKVLETALGAWGVTYQDTDVPSSPSDIVTDEGIDALFDRAKLSNL